MGTCYTLILYDEQDWSYTKNTLEVFEKEWPRYLERLAKWPDYVVYDIDKCFPEMEEYKNILYKFCQKAYCYGDTATYDLKEIDFSKQIEKTIEAQKPPKQREVNSFPSTEDCLKLKEKIFSVEESSM